MEQIIEHGPDVLTLDNVQYWSKHTKELTHRQIEKALFFLEYDCIQYVGDDDEFNSKYTFVCLPLNTREDCQVYVNGLIRTFGKKVFVEDYNWSDYKIYKNAEGNFECNCQGWQTKAKRGELVPDGANCSHVLALFYAFKIGKFTRQHGAEEHHIKIDPHTERAEA